MRGAKRVEDARERAYDPRIHLFAKKFYQADELPGQAGNDDALAWLCYACALRCGSMICSSLPSTRMQGSSCASAAFGSRFSLIAAMNSRSSSSMPSMETSTLETSI